RYSGALGEAGKTGRHHDLAGNKTGCDHGLLVVLLGHGDRTHRDRGVVLDDIDIGAGRAALHSRGGNNYDLAQSVDQDSHVGELAGPELQLIIREYGLEPHRAGGLIDLIVDDQHFAVVDRLAVGPERLDRQHALGEATVEIREGLLWQVEK